MSHSRNARHILGEIKDVDPAVRENDPHADRGVTQTMDTALSLREGTLAALFATSQKRHEVVSREIGV
jgi:hypothetical protein